MMIDIIRNRQKLRRYIISAFTSSLKLQYVTRFYDTTHALPSYRHHFIMIFLFYSLSLGNIRQGWDHGGDRKT